MTLRALCFLTALLLTRPVLPAEPAAQNDGPRTARAAERRALRYLTHEVPRWARENDCYSCHNNGDAARALYTAVRLGRDVDRDALAGTTAWLQRPGRWKDNGGEAAFSDKKLAALQFAAALAGAVEAGLVKHKAPLRRAANKVAACQDEDGSWVIDPPQALGAPTTWGRFLATARSRQVLLRAGRERFKQEIAAADRRLRAEKPGTVLDAAAVLIGLGKSDDEEARKQRRHCLDLIRRGESQAGGWGPYVTAPPEPFDTAVVLLALAKQPDGDRFNDMLTRGRSYLVRTQLEDGSWPETTRPPGAESYAQRLSTTAWATQALLVTRGR